VDPHAGQPIVHAGTPLGESPAAVIMVHGRNAGPANILDLVPRLARPNLTYLAPAAANRAWYPHSFLTEIAGPGSSRRTIRFRWSRVRCDLMGFVGWRWKATTSHQLCCRC
jgi:phospholipase/carboxylesterase